MSKQYETVDEEDLTKNIQIKNSNTSSFLSSVYAFCVKYHVLVKISIFAAYMFVGVMIFTEVEGWNVLDAVYFMVVTFTTVGYGYFHPTTASSKIYDMISLVFGVTVILGFVNEFAKTVLMSAQDEVIERLFALRGVELTLPRRFQARSIVSLVLVVLCLLSGTLFFSGNEDWDVLDSFYWTLATMTTVGYGDPLSLSIYPSINPFISPFSCTCFVFKQS